MMFLILLLILTTSISASSQAVDNLPGFAGKLPFKLETGYVGVGQSDTVQLFYYFIESERNPDEDPLLLWLDGGPGCSGFYGVAYEVGPLLFDYAKSSSGREKVPSLKLNPYSWTKVSNIIFLDAPVGTGFSYATNSEAYEVSDTSSATQTSEFLRKWLLSHPRFLKNPLYVCGASYTGKVIPIIVEKISDANDAGLKPHLNLKGYSLGNPITDLTIDENWRIAFAHRIGLISDKIYESTKKHCHGEYVNVDPSNAACVENLEILSECTKMIYTLNILEPNCASIAPKPKGWLQPNLSNLDLGILPELSLELLSAPPKHSRRWCRRYNYVFSYIWANDETVQTALHVRKGTIKEWSRCNKTLASDYDYNVQSTVPYHRNLTKKGYTVLIYSGDHDMAVPYLATRAWVESLNLTVSSKWKPWFVERQVAGYSVHYTHNNNYSLVYATVKGAGHTATEYNPKECFAMFTRWVSRSPL